MIHRTELGLFSKNIKKFRNYKNKNYFNQNNRIIIIYIINKHTIPIKDSIKYSQKLVVKRI